MPNLPTLPTLEGPTLAPGFRCAASPPPARLKRLVSAVLVEIDEKWAGAEKAYIKWKCQDD